MFIADLLLELLTFVFALVVRPVLIGVLTALLFIGGLLSRLYMSENKFLTILLWICALVLLIQAIQIIYYLV